MAIPSVVQGIIETQDGKVFELDSPKGTAWVETIGSFRFEPSGDSKPCTIRREPSGYWYGCRKVAGKVRKKYIGKTSEVSTAKLEEIAAALEVPPVPRVAQVAEVAQGVAEVTQVADKVAQDRLTVLELEVANLRKALEALQEALPGKLESGDSAELPKVDSEVAEQLQKNLSNLRAENEKLKQELVDARTDYAKLLESSTVVTNKLREEVQEVRSQLETEKTRGEEIWEELSDTEQTLAEVRSENSELKKTCAELRSQLEPERADREEVEDSEFLKEENEGLKRLLDNKSPLALSDFYVELQKLRERHREHRLKAGEEHRASIVQIAELKRQAENMARSNGELQSELADLKQKSAAARELPEAAEILNQLKSKRKKSKTDLADLEAILEILES